MSEHRTASLSKRRQQRRLWAMLFAMLALVVAGVTAHALIRVGQAATDEQVLPEAHVASAHEHSAECYDESGALICDFEGELGVGDSFGDVSSSKEDRELQPDETAAGSPAGDEETLADDPSSELQGEEGAPVEAYVAAEMDGAEDPSPLFEEGLSVQAAPSALAANGVDVEAQRAAFQAYLSEREQAAPNEWQIVQGRYEGNGPDQKTVAEGGDVRLQKNVIPTDVENEFLVYLSIDVREQYAEYFEKAVYEATTSNNYHDENVGTVVEAMTGNQKVKVSGEAIYENSALFTILDPDNNTLAKDVKLYWSQANNVTFYLKTSTGQYILMGLSVKKGGTNQVVLSLEAYESIRQDMLQQQAALESVVDEMGDYVTYLGVESSCPAGQDVQLGSDGRTLTWKPTVDGSDLLSETVGGVTTVWYGNVAQLVYKVRLDVTKDGFNSCAANMNSTMGDKESYAVNESAVLTYDDGKKAVFPAPSVRGLLYTAEAQKVDAETGKPLAGAQFGLFAADKLVAKGTSDERGAVAIAPALPWGDYLLRELAAPAGYEVSDRQESLRLCYTTDSDVLEPAGAFMKRAGDPLVFENERAAAKHLLLKKLAEGSQSALAGATFTLWARDGEHAGSYVDADGSLREDAVFLTTDETGIIFDGDLGEGTYVLTETAAPGGYNRLEHPLVVAVNADTILVDDPNASDRATGGNLVPGKDGSYYYSISNSMGTRMPETGGAGTRVWQSAGMLLVVIGLSVGLVRYRGRERRAVS